jgi:DNA-directed RNA polymerase sigma subunit (sigma70/sigma32)
MYYGVYPSDRAYGTDEIAAIYELSHTRIQQLRTRAEGKLRELARAHGLERWE